MPSGAGSGIIHSETFTPDAAGSLVVTVTYDCKGTSGDDWGASFTTHVFCTQDGTTTDGTAVPMSTGRISQTLRGVFDVVAGLSCEIGIYGGISGAVAADWWNIHITAELIKR
jgi:hypothetical protein